MTHIGFLIMATIKRNRSLQNELPANGVHLDYTGMVLYVGRYILYLCHCHYFVADAEEIPYQTKFLLIASFLASYNTAKSDVRYFSEVCVVLCYVYLHFFTCNPFIICSKKK